ncbi:pyridoxal phosphate-dependent decarboxylase family protein [Kitasatospora aureofaciens]|uniref:pyridoxal phosphate-dependent decarboxylase family protein n=1 Tax=Kitasatospora aureofaciens TaxID=1894 RepID=UPI0033FCF14F
MTPHIARERREPSPTVAPELQLADAPGTHSLAAWFLGPMAENQTVLADLINDALAAHCAARRNLYRDDPPYVTDGIKQSPEYQQSVATMRREHAKLLDYLGSSVPFFSYRYQAHMNWDQTIPALAGYFAATLYNPNNVALESSPVTTRLEEEVGKDLCRLLGYQPLALPTPWGHITSGGTVANLEALWSARNLTYYPIAVAEAIRRHPHALGGARDLTVRMANGKDALRLLDLDAWECVNLPVDEVLGLPTRMVEEHRVRTEDLGLINAYTLQHLGYEEFRRRFLEGKVGNPAVLVTATMHYSWPKAAALLGIGQSGLVPVEVDLDARATVASLRTRVEECIRGRRPVILNVAVLGSTEQSSVDPLAEMLALREEFHERNVSYPIHVDAAWGGYFAAVRRPRPTQADGQVTYTPDFVMSEYVNRQYDSLDRADSITIDPHKAGFVPYPAGGLCYRNGAQKNMVAFTAPYLDLGNSGVGLYGVEGSKPGAAAAGVYLSHRVITTDQHGYGKILGQALFNSKRLYAAFVTLGLDHPDLLVAPLQRLPVERERPGDARALREQLRFILDRIVCKSNEEIRTDPEARELLAELGSDQVVIAYAFNAVRQGQPNPDLAKANRINRLIAEKLGVAPTVPAARNTPASPQRPDLIVSGSALEPGLYGGVYMRRVADRLGLQGDPSGTPIRHLVSCTLDPWLTDTERGDFIPVLREALAEGARAAIREVFPEPAR